MSADVVVLGSANVDLFAEVGAIPAPGETTLAAGPTRRPGGKGLNQAVAASRAGARTVMLGAVGQDDSAEVLLAAAAEAGVGTDLLRRLPGPSGTAWIMVQPDGENAIVVLGAANRAVVALLPPEVDAIRGAKVLVTQLETPVDAVRAAAAAARSAGARVVLNASPPAALPAELVGLVDVFVVNEHERRTLGDLDTGSGATLVVTLGADGALIVDAAGERRVPGVRADAIDTTGAGDTFAGVLAARLAAGATVDDAVRHAVVAGALAVTRRGAQPGVTAADIDRRLLELEGTA